MKILPITINLSCDVIGLDLGQEKDFSTYRDTDGNIHKIERLSKEQLKKDIIIGRKLGKTETITNKLKQIKGKAGVK